MLIASTFLLWTIAALLLIAVAALMRQVRALQRDMSSLEHSPMQRHAIVGAPVPLLIARGADDRPLLLGAPQPGSRGMLLIFVAAATEQSLSLVEPARGIAARRRLELVFVGADEFDPRMAAEVGSGAIYARSRFAHDTFEASDTPVAVLLRPDGVVAAKHAVGSSEDLEDLVAAGQLPSFADLSEAIAMAGLRRARQACAA
ncbi:MAG: hypothetical protein JWN59_1257 [Sphingomonas bacterium]|nr:hypothetical protein [Sphingomonas bacterium]